MTKRANPEAALQIRVKQMLTVRLPEDVMWIGGAAGLWLPIGIRMKAHSQGCLNAGWPDLSFISSRGAMFIELKQPNAPKNALLQEQKEFRDLCKLAGVPWAEARSVEAVAMMLEYWGIPLRPPPEPGAYDDGLTMSEAFE